MAKTAKIRARIEFRLEQEVEKFFKEMNQSINQRRPAAPSMDLSQTRSYAGGR